MKTKAENSGNDDSYRLLGKGKAWNIIKDEILRVFHDFFFFFFL